MRKGDYWEVEEGDTLTAIAEKCGVSLGDLLRWNLDIVDANKIYPDQRIKVSAPKDKKVEDAKDDCGRFEVCVGRVLDHEGGAVDDNEDPGGSTNYGISQFIFPKMREDDITKAENVFDITREEAKEAYWKYFWLPVKCSNYHAGVDYFLFDSAIQHGGGMARKWGDIVKTSRAKEALEFLRMKRRDYYEGIIRRRPTSEKYRVGWMRRLKEVYEVSLRDAKKVA